jgi:hypothetical protein
MVDVKSLVQELGVPHQCEGGEPGLLVRRVRRVATRGQVQPARWHLAQCELGDPAGDTLALAPDAPIPPGTTSSRVDALVEVTIPAAGLGALV